MTTIAIILILLFLFRKPISKVVKFSVRTVATILFILVLVAVFKGSDFYKDMIALHPNLPEEAAAVEGAKDITKGLIVVGTEVIHEEYNNLVDMGIKNMTDTIR